MKFMRKNGFDLRLISMKTVFAVTVIITAAMYIFGIVKIILSEINNDGAIVLALYFAAFLFAGIGVPFIISEIAFFDSLKFLLSGGERNARRVTVNICLLTLSFAAFTLLLPANIKLWVIDWDIPSDVEFIFGILFSLCAAILKTIDVYLRSKMLKENIEK